MKQKDPPPPVRAKGAHVFTSESTKGTDFEADGVVEGVRVEDREAPRVGEEEELGIGGVTDEVGEKEGVSEREGEEEGAIGVMDGVAEGEGKGETTALASPPPLETSNVTSASNVRIAAGEDTVKNWVKTS